MMRYAVGSDLGGTNIATAVIDETGKVLGKAKLPTEADKGPEHVIANIMRSIDMALADASMKIEDMVGIGLGIPGLMDIEKGISLFAGNLGWKNVEVIKPFKERYGLPTFMDNDVRVATLGEWKYGAGKGVNNLICVTLGTGIGSGLVFEGKLLRGVTNSVGEIGHVTVEKDGLICNCGNQGCVEMYASGTGQARMARLMIQSGHFSIMTKMVGGDLSKINSKIIQDAYDEGDTVAIQVMNKTAMYLGIALADYINLVNPELVIIGGGVSLAGERLMKPLREEVYRRVMIVPRQIVKIVRSELGDESGMIGAAALAFERQGII